jgi:hypothetical protein
MKKFLITIYYYGASNSFGGPSYLQARAEVKSDSEVHAEWKTAELLGIRQYYATWVEEIV